jgi:gingipain R
VSGGKAMCPVVPNGISLLEKGSPDLNRLSASITIPDQDEMQVEVISSDYTDIANIDIAPSKGGFNRKTKPASVPYTYNETYLQNSFFPGKLVELGDAYILRDLRGQTIYTYPLQYNPVTKTLRIYKNISVKITSKNHKGGTNQLIRERKPEYIDKEFNDTYQSRFLNYKTSAYTPLDEKGQLLIISRADCIAAMQPLVAWKKLKGIQTEIVSIATVGNTSAAILSYIQAYYASHPTLKFVLLVGDHENITSGPQLTDPTDNTNKGVSDVYYGKLVGTDNYPEVLVGRFSCASVADAQTQVDRTIHYERDLKLTDTWLNKAVTFANGETNTTGAPLHYTNMQFIQNIITPFLKSTVYNGTPLNVSVPNFVGQPYAADPNLTVVLDTVNKGRSTLIQEGEGDYTGFWFSNNTGFTTSNVPSLTNVNKLPHVWSVACDVGQFNGKTCFAEAMLRSHNSGNTGAITAYMGSCLQAWDPPYDQVNESIGIMTGQQLATNYKISAGGIAYNGSMKMMDDYTTAQAGPFTANTLVLFGDPSIVLNTTNLASMTVSHAPTIPLQATNFVVNCNITNALISLTVGGEIIATAYSNGGANTININPAVSNTVNDTMKVTVTAQNHVTYMSNVIISTLLGIHQISESSIVIFPNPTTGSFDIKFNQYLNYQNATVSVFNVLGERLMEKKIIDNSPIHMDAGALQAGVYLVELKVNQSIYLEKITITK